MKLGSLDSVCFYAFSNRNHINNLPGDSTVKGLFLSWTETQMHPLPESLISICRDALTSNFLSLNYSIIALPACVNTICIKEIPTLREN